MNRSVHEIEEKSFSFLNLPLVAIVGGVTSQL